MPASATSSGSRARNSKDEAGQRAHDAPDWTVFTLIGAAILILSCGIILAVPGVIAATEVLVRATTCTWFLLLLAGLAAPSLAKRLPSRFTRALMRERRSFLLSSALALLVTLAAIAALAVVNPERVGLSVLVLIDPLSTMGAIFAVALFLTGVALLRLPSKRRRARVRANRRISPRS